MLHTKFQGNRPSDSGVVDKGYFIKGFIIFGHGGHLGLVTWTKYTVYIFFPLPGGCI